jgi:hypothetical protein
MEMNKRDQEVVVTENREVIRLRSEIEQPNQQLEVPEE